MSKKVLVLVILMLIPNITLAICSKSSQSNCVSANCGSTKDTCSLPCCIWTTNSSEGTTGVATNNDSDCDPANDPNCSDTSNGQSGATIPPKEIRNTTNGDNPMVSDTSRKNKDTTAGEIASDPPVPTDSSEPSSDPSEEYRDTSNSNSYGGETPCPPNCPKIPDDANPNTYEYRDTTDGNRGEILCPDPNNPDCSNTTSGQTTAQEDQAVPIPNDSPFSENYRNPKNSSSNKTRCPDPSNPDCANTEGSGETTPPKKLTAPIPNDASFPEDYRNTTDGESNSIADPTVPNNAQSGNTTADSQKEYRNTTGEDSGKIHCPDPSNPDCANTEGGGDTVSPLDNPTGPEYVDTSNASGGITAEPSETTKLPEHIIWLAILSLLISTLVFVDGVVISLTAKGNIERIKKGENTRKLAIGTMLALLIVIILIFIL